MNEKRGTLIMSRSLMRGVPLYHEKVKLLPFY